MAFCLGAFVLLSFAFSRVLCSGVLAAARKLGFVDRPGGRKTQAAPVPLGGGIGILGAVAGLAGMGALLGPAALALARPHLAGETGEALEKIVLGSRVRLGDLGLLLGCALGMGLLGLVDDRRGLKPAVKLAVQAILATLLYSFCSAGPFRVTLFTPLPALWFALTLLWIVGVTNAFNFMDNMDGLCAVVSAATALLFTALAVQTGQFLIASLFAVIAGAVLGFLPLNLPPARMYLGDAGSLSLGFLLSSLAVLLTFYEADESPWVLAAPLLVLAVPLFDLGTVLAIRWKAGRPLTVGDQNHFSHRLLNLGMSPRQVLACVGALVVCIGLTATTLYALPPVAAGLALMEAVGILFVVWLLERSGKSPKGPRP